MKAFPSENSGKRRVAIYIRVSTAEQKIEGYSLEAQRKKLLDYVNNNTALNLTTKEEWIFTDTHTGSDLVRPQLEKLREGVRERKFDAVLVWKIDRLSRSLKHLLMMFEEMEKHDVSFISVQENIDFKGPIGKLIFQIFGAIAQFERELIKGRTQMGKIASAEMGNYTGNSIPYGYEAVKNKSGRGKRLKIIPQEKEWVEKMYQWSIYEEMGLGQITNRLNTLGVPRGNQTKEKSFLWTEKIVRNILSNPIYRGEFVANRKDENGRILPEDKWTVVEIPPCVSEFTFQQAQNARGDRKGSGAETDYLLSGKIKDMGLKKPKSFVGKKRSDHAYSYARKQFKEKDGTPHPVFEIPAKQIEEYVWGKIMEAMQNPETFIKTYLSQEYSQKTSIVQIEEEISLLREKKVNVEMNISRIENAFENGTYSEEKMTKRIMEKEEEMNRIEDGIQEKEDKLIFLSSLDIEVEKLKSASEEVKYRLENLTPKQKKILCNLFVDRIEMNRTREGSRWKVSAEIFFRFNPQKFNKGSEEGRTGEDLEENEKKTSSEEKALNGATGRI
ncbi:recombinase family protein [Candidatus Peregrinibacteria bacterium]|nr:MAG: recombinase family protein [Candidatus Peregrinibacteria bacterium]